MDGGPLRRLQRALALPPTVPGLLVFGCGIALLTWVPLAALCGVAQTFTSGPTVHFCRVSGRMYDCSRRLRCFSLLRRPSTFACEGIGTIVSSEIVPARELPLLGTALSRAKRWRDSTLVALTIFLIVEGARTDSPGTISTWRNAASGHLSATGWWYMLVSLPVYQVLIWRWCARLLIWWHLLWRMPARFATAGDAPGPRRRLGGSRRRAVACQPGQRLWSHPRHAARPHLAKPPDELVIRSVRTLLQL
jgi:hypothetical protein